MQPMNRLVNGSVSRWSNDVSRTSVLA